MRGVGVGRRDEASCMATGIGHHRVGRHHEASCMATGIKHACVNRARRSEYRTKLAMALRETSDCTHDYCSDLNHGESQPNLKHSEPGVADCARGWGWLA